MPNWCFNRVVLSGEPSAIDSLLAHLCRRAGLQPGEGLSRGETASLLDGNNDKVCLSSFLKEDYPETFLKYDTANHPDGRGLVTGEDYLDIAAGHTVRQVTEDLIREYKEATAYQRETYGVVGWFDYNCRYLGCKWDSFISSLFLDGDTLEISVDTPWSPPEPWAGRLSGDWGLCVTLSYEEEGHNYAPAELYYVDGDLVSEEERPVYCVLGLSYSDDDEMTEALGLLEEATGIELESYDDEYILGEEVQSRLKAWQDSLPDDDVRKRRPVLERIW